MLYALDPATTARIEAAPKRAGSCPGCRAPLIAKCGELVTRHWAHRARRDCDSWWEPECAWHLDWKRRFPPGAVEVVMGPHRADVSLPWGVIEFQHSAISPDEIRARESFYGRMAWVFDARPFAERVDLRPLRRDWTARGVGLMPRSAGGTRAGRTRWFADRCFGTSATAGCCACCGSRLELRRWAATEGSWRAMTSWRGV